MLTVAAVLSASGCVRHHVRVIRVPVPASTSATPVPQVTRTIVRNTRVYRVGHPAPVAGQSGVSLRVTVDRPSVSRTRLSSSYGYPPSHGYYLTFPVTIVNTGDRPVTVQPQEFVVRIAGQGRVTSYDGSSPYSGASRQLNATEVEPGGRTSGPLTFDVRAVHGRIAFVPDKTAAVVWRF